MLDLGTSFLASVARDPEALAIVDGDVRLTYGASWGDLFRNRCYEVVPLRGLFWIVLGLAWVAFLTDVVLFVVRAFVKLRTTGSERRELGRKLAAVETELKSRLDIHEAAIVDVLQRILHYHQIKLRRLKFYVLQSP